MMYLQPTSYRGYSIGREVYIYVGKVPNLLQTYLEQGFDSI